MAKRVAVVDNVAEVREALSEAIRTMFPEVVQVDALPDGPSLLAHCAETEPDLVFLDVDMPAPDGVETFYLLKAEHPTVARRVFFLTGFAGAPSTNQRLEKAVADGAGGFMSKPASAAALQRVAERILSGS